MRDNLLSRMQRVGVIGLDPSSRAPSLTFVEDFMQLSGDCELQGQKKCSGASHSCRSSPSSIAGLSLFYLLIPSSFMSFFLGFNISWFIISACPFFCLYFVLDVILLSFRLVWFSLCLSLRQVSSPRARASPSLSLSWLCRCQPSSCHSDTLGCFFYSFSVFTLLLPVRISSASSSSQKT